MEPLIPDSNTDARMAGLEHFIERYLGPRQPEFGASEDEIRSIKMPAPLQRFFRFAGRWPGHNPRTPYANRFCMQDTLCALQPKDYAQPLQVMDERLVFVWEAQGVWVAATEQAGDDPPVWISENWWYPPVRISENWWYKYAARTWTRLENPLSHFLVSFVVQELTFGSELVAVAQGALTKFETAGIKVEPVWIRGEYASGIDRPSYFLAGDHILVRQAPNEAGGEDWYGCNSLAGGELLTSLRLPTQID